MFNNYRKIIVGLLAFLLTLPVFSTALAEPVSDENVLDVSAPYAILIDADTGEIIYQKDADVKQSIGTVTKTMSLLLFAEAIESGEWKLDTEVTISKNAAQLSGSTAFLDSGSKYTVEQLLKSVCMTSANDACMALAEKLCGSEEVFVQKMNQRAKELGINDVTFSNCTGLGEDGNMLSAKDVGIIACQTIKHSQLLTYCDIWMDTLVHNGGRETELTNANKLIRFYDACDGLQTGSSTSTGYCIAGTAQQSGLRLVCVIIGAQNSEARQSDSKELFEYGFANFSSLKIVREGQIMKRNVAVKGGVEPTVDVVSSEDVVMLLEKGEEGKITTDVVFNSELTAPLTAGEEIGQVQVKKDGETILSVPLTVKESVQSSTLMYYFEQIISDWLKIF